MADPSQLQQLKLNQGQMMAGSPTQMQGQVSMQQLSPGQMSGGGSPGFGGQLSPGGSVQMGGQMMVGGGQMVGGVQMIGQSPTGQFAGGAQMMSPQMMAGSPTSPMGAGMVAMSPTQQMVGGQMAASTTGVQMSTAGMAPAGMVQDVSQVSMVTQGGVVSQGNVGMVTQGGMNMVGQSGASMVSQSDMGMVSQSGVGMVSQAGMGMVNQGISQGQVGMVSQGMVDQTNMVVQSEASMVSQSMVSQDSMVSQSQISMVDQSQIGMVGHAEVGIVGQAQVGMVSQGMVDQSGMVVQNEANMVSQTMVGEASMVSQGQVGMVSQSMVDQSGMVAQGQATMVSQSQVGMVSQDLVSQGMVDQSSMMSQTVVSETGMLSQSEYGMVSEVGMVEQTGMVTQGVVQDGMVSECMVSEVGMVGQISEVGMTSTTIDSTTIQTIPTIMVESQQSIADPGSSSMQVMGTVDQSLDTSMTQISTVDQTLEANVNMQVVGTVDQSLDTSTTMEVVGVVDPSITTYPDGSTMEVIGTVSPAPPSDPSVCVYPVSPAPPSDPSVCVYPVSPAPPSDPSVCVYPVSPGPIAVSPDPGYTMDTIGMVPGESTMFATKTTEITELEAKITTLKHDFEIERSEVETRYIKQMKDIEVRCQQEKEEMRHDFQREEDNYERKLKEERSRLNEVQLKLSVLQAEVDNNEKSGKRQEDEIDELEDKLRKVKNERDQFDELNRRLKMELQRCQQQSYSDKTSIKQLQDKLSQADNTEREWMTKFNREKEKVNEHYEKITIIENTVSSLEKQNRDYVVEIEHLNRQLKKEKDECDQLRAMLSEESKDDEKYNKVIRELQRKVKDLDITIEDIDNKWRTEKDKVNKLNADIFMLNAEKTKFQKLSKGLREDVDELTSKYTREKSEVERLEEELARLRREHTDSKNTVDVDSIITSFEEKIRRLTAECDSFEEKYKYEKREKAEFEDKFHRVKSEITDIQEKYRRVDIERDTYIRKCREITDSYEQKIRVLQQQISELRTQPSRPVQPIPQPLPVPQPTIVSYPTAPCYVDTMNELGISIERYNEMKHQRDSIEQRYNALVDLLAKYEDEVQKLEKENKDFRLSVSDVDYTSINITRHESNATYTQVEFRRIVDEKDYFEGRYKKEKAERENAEKKLRDLRNTKEDLEDKLNDVARVITKYEQDTRAFRNENDQLRRQLQDLMMNRNFQKNISVEYNVTKRQRSDSNKSLDKYKHEIDELHRENEEFKQLLDSLDNKDGGKGDKDDGKNNTGRVRALEGEVNSLQTVITELEKTIAYQNKSAEDAKLQLEDEKWRLREHVQKLEDKVKDQVRMIDDYDRKINDLRNKFTNEVSQLGEKLVNEVDRNMKLEEHIKQLQKHLADLDGERREILTKYDAVSINEQEFVRDMEDLEDRYKIDITELQNRLNQEMNEKSNLNRDIQHLLDELDNLRARENAIETQFIRERDEIKGHYEFEKIDLLRQYHEENTRIKAQLDDEKRKRKQLEDEIEILRRKLAVQGVNTNIDTGSGGGRGDVNVSLGDDNRRRDYLEEENKKLLYQINLLLSKKDGGDDSRDSGGRSSDSSSDDITRLRRKLTIAEEERDKFERMKKDLEYEMDRYKSKCDTLQTEIERFREMERKTRDLTDEVRSLKSINDELNRKQRDLMSENDNLNRTCQDLERDNRKLQMEIEHLTMQLKKSSGSAGKTNIRDETTIVNSGGRSEEMLKIKYEFESKLKDQVDANRQLEKNIRDLQREMDGMHDSRSLMQSNFNQQKEFMMQQIAGSVRGDVETNRQNDEWKRRIEESERRFKNELDRLNNEKKDECNRLKREKDLLQERFDQEREQMRRKIFDIEEQFRRKESTWSSPSPTPVQPVSYPSPVSHGRDDIQGILREKDSYIEQLKTEKYESVRNFEREKNRMAMDFDMERNKAKKTIDELEDALRTLKKQKTELEEKVTVEMVRDIEIKHTREKDRLELEFNEEKRQLKKNLDRDLESRREDMKRECESKYNKIINDLEREKARLLGRLERERGEVNTFGTTIHQSSYEETNLTGISSKYEAENRELQRRLKEQAQNFELEKQELLKRCEQEKRVIEARLVHEKKVLEISVQAMTREIAKLKHERNEIRKNYKAEIDKLRAQLEHSGFVATHESNTTNNTREVHTSHTSSHTSVAVMSREERHTFEKTIDELNEKVRDHETTVQKLERNHTEEIRYMVKNFENEKADLENSWMLEKGRVQASIEADYEQKLTNEKKKFEVTMTALRREVNCLQDQRRLLQMKITSNSAFVGDKDAFDRSISDYKQDVLEKLQREYGERIERERRPLEETIKELRREVDDLRRERNDIRSSFRQEKVKLQEDFDRERERLVRERHEIKIAGGVGVGGLAGVMFGAGGLGGRLGPNDDDKVPKDKDDPLGQIQKSFQESNVKRYEVEITSLKEENIRLVNDNRSLTAKLEALEIRNKHLAFAANKKDRPRRGYGGSRSPTRPSVLDGLVLSGGSGAQPTVVGASPDRRYPGSAAIAGQRYPAGATSPMRGGYSPGGRYMGPVGGTTTSPGAGSYPGRAGPYGVGSPDRTSGVTGPLGSRVGGATSSPTGRKYPLGGSYGGASPGSGVIPGQAGSPSSAIPGRLSSPSGSTPFNRPSGLTGRPGGSAPGSGFGPSSRDPSPGSRPGGDGSGVPSGALSPRPGGPGFPGRDPSPGCYPSSRIPLSTIYDTSPTRGPLDRAVSETNTREISVRNSSLHHRSLSAEYFHGRGTDISFGGRSRPLGSSLQGRLGSGFGGPVGYADITRIRSAYGVGGGPFGFDGGNAGYMGDGQFIPAGYDGYIDDSGLGVDGNYGCGGCAVRGDPPAVNVDPPQGGAQCTSQYQTSSGGQQADGQQAQGSGQQAHCGGGVQAQAGGQQMQCGGGMQAQTVEQIQISAAPTGCAIGQSVVSQGTVDLTQVGQTTMISPTSEGKDTCTTTSSDSEKED